MNTPAFRENEAPVARHCAQHPGVETYLLCGKCDRPICPKCVVMTPVGARCRDCARPRRLPTYDLSARYYAQAIGAGLVVALVCGILGAQIRMTLPLASVIVPIAIGYAAGESISASVNRKRGRPLRIIAGVAVVLALAIQSSAMVIAQMPSMLGASAVASLLVATTIGMFLQPLSLFVLAIAVYVAVSRL